MNNIDEIVNFDEYKIDRFTFYKSKKSIKIETGETAYFVLIQDNKINYPVACMGMDELSPMQLSAITLNIPLTLPDLDLLLSEANLFIMEWSGRN